MDELTLAAYALSAGLLIGLAWMLADLFCELYHVARLKNNARKWK